MLSPTHLAEVEAAAEIALRYRPARVILAVSCDSRGVVRLEVERIEGVSPTQLLRPVGDGTGLT